MAERYARQFEFINAVHLKDCPVALEKGAVLLDTKTNTYMLQLKLANLGALPIKSVQIFVEAFDSEGNQAYKDVSSGITARYDEIVNFGGFFATKQLLPLPNNNAVSFCVYVESVVFQNDGAQSFSREQYMRRADSRDISYERSQTFDKESQNRAKVYNSTWGAWWYHIAMSVSALLSVCFFLFNRISAMEMILFASFWIYTWRSIGSPEFLKRSAKSALFLIATSLLLHLVSYLQLWRYWGYFAYLLFSSFARTSIPFLIYVIVCFLPFLCVFLNVRRFDKSITFIPSLLFWMTPTNNTVDKAQQHAVPPSSRIIKSPDHKLLCPHCGERATIGAKFCVKCGDELNS